MTVIREVASLYFDHVEVTVVWEDGVHLAVELLEGILNGVSLQCVVAFILTDVMVACAKRDVKKKKISNEQ